MRALTVARIHRIERPDGASIAVHDFGPPLRDGRPAGVALLVHGLGEHVGRYAHVAQALREAGWHAWGYDHHGHGQSGGQRGALPCPARLLDDLGLVMDLVRAQSPCDSPLVLIGHSMGGLVVARAAIERIRPVDAVVMSSPALAAPLNPLQRLLLRTLPRVAPHWRVDNGVKVDFVSRDREVVQRYRNDPLVHRKISAALAAWVVDMGARTIAQAASWDTPALLLYAGADRLVDPRGSDAFAATAPPHRVRALRYDTLYHEIFNEPERVVVLADLLAWLQRQGAHP